MSTFNKMPFKPSTGIKLLVIGLTITVAACQRNFGPGFDANKPVVAAPEAKAESKSTLNLKEDKSFKLNEVSFAMDGQTSFKGSRLEVTRNADAKDFLTARIELTHEDSEALMGALALDAQNVVDEKGEVIGTQNVDLSESVGMAQLRTTEHIECSSQVTINEDGSLQDKATTACIIAIEPKTGTIMMATTYDEATAEKLKAENRTPVLNQTYVGNNLALIKNHERFHGQIQIAGEDAKALYNLMMSEATAENLGLENEASTAKKVGANISCMMTLFKDQTAKFRCGLNLDYKTGKINFLDPK